MRKPLLTLTVCCLCTIAQAQQPNIIFFLVDDLNDYIGVLGGHPQVETPHIDALAARGVTFINAYTNASGCAPSRTSLLSGKTPAYTGVLGNYDYQNPFRNNFSEATDNATVFTIPEVLKDSGNYYTYGLGKFFHSPTDNDYDKVSPTCSKSLSWNRMYAIQETPVFMDESSEYLFSPELDFGKIPDALESDMADQRVADSAVAFIHGFANNTVNTCERPFFLGVGIRKPHSDRLIPEHYFPNYFAAELLADTLPIIYNNPPDATPFNGLVMPPQPDPMFNDYYALPEGGVGRYLADQNEMYGLLTGYVDDLPYLPVIDPALSDTERIAILEETMRANYLASYIAAVQYMDSIIGRIMGALHEHPDLAANTVVIFTSDHGYALGEKRHWTKWALWETDIRVPLIISHPDFAQNAITKRVASLLDIFPTVCSIAGVNAPTFPDGSPYLDGHDLLPYVIEPDQQSACAALTFTKSIADAGSCFVHYSVRTERFHYIRYKLNAGAFGAECDTTTAEYEYEFYDIGADRQKDPNEWNNLANDPEYAPVISYLEAFLPDGALYNSEPLTVNIYSSNNECLLSSDAVTKMRCLLLYPDGTPIDEAELDNYTFTWTNNLTADIFTGSQYNFSLASIDDVVFTDADNLIFYLKVTETATGDPVAFRIREFQLHPESVPEIDYSVTLNGLQLDIEDVTINGTAQSVSWNFGDGISVTQTDPGPHTYASEGLYTITTTIQYGNKCSVTQSQVIDVDSTVFRLQQPDIHIHVYPNPATDQVIISLPGTAQNCHAELTDMQGNRLHVWSVTDAGSFATLNLPKIPAGAYVLRITGNYFHAAELLVVQHP